MTTVNETVQPQAGKPAKPSKSVGIVPNIVLSFAWWALVASILGIAMRRGFGISLPFTPTFLLASTFGAVTKGLARTLGEAWHGERVKADINLIVATTTVQQAARER